MSTQQVQTLGLAVISFIVSQLVAFVPSLGPDKQNLLSGGGSLLALGILIAGSLHHLASQPARTQTLTIGTNSPAVTTSNPPLALSTADQLRSQLISAGIEPTA